MKLREFGQPISATKKLLRWLYPDVRRKVDRVKFGGGGVLQKNQATYVPYGPDAGHHHIAVGKGSDLNVLWHEAGHHKDRESLRKILKSGDVPRWKSELKADNNAEALLRKFGGDVSHYRKMRKTPVGLIKDQGNWINDPVSGYDLSAKLRLREFVRVMGGADIPASMSQIRSVWRTFKNAAPGKIVRSTTQGSSFGPRGMVVQKAASGAKIDREALLAGATNTTNYPITSALHEGGHALFNKAMTGSANQQFLPRLGRGPTPEKHPLRGVQIMANEIGANNSAVQVLRGAGVKQDAVSDFMKFRQRGIDSHMRSARDHVAAAPVGLTPQRHQEIKGAFNRWITDWKRSPASPNAKLSVDAPELVKKDFESAKLRLRELALGAGTRIRHIPLGERRGIAKKLREAFSEADAPAMAGVPRMIRTGGGDFLLSYRAASQKQRLVFPHSHLGPLADPDAKELRKSKGGRKVAVNNRGHQLAPQDASIGTSTSRSFVDGFNFPYLGVYATPIKQIQSRADAGKLGFPNINAAKAGFNRHYEAEVAQPNGGNIISVRESVGRNEVADDLKSQFSKRGFTGWNRKRVSSRAEEVMIPWGERGKRDEFVDGLAKRNNKALSAKLRLIEITAKHREFARGDYAIPALGKMLKDRSFLEEFLTGKRGPKLGDLRVNKLNGSVRVPGSILPTGLPHDSGPYVERISDTIKASTPPWEVFEKSPNHGYSRSPHLAPAFIRAKFDSARQQARSQIAKMIRKGRAGGDVYEEVNRP